MPSIIVPPLDYRGLARVATLPIAASQTFKEGDYGIANTSGLVEQAATAGDGTSTNGQVPIWASGITNLIVGRYIEDAQPSPNDPTILPTAKTYGKFIIAEPGTQFAIPLFHATAASAYPNPNLLATGFELWNLNSSATGVPSGTTFPSNVYVIRIDKTTAVKAQIVDFWEETFPTWPGDGNAAVSVPSSGTLSQYATCWIEFLGGATYLSGARPIVRTN